MKLVQIKLTQLKNLDAYDCLKLYQDCKDHDGVLFLKIKVTNPFYLMIFRPDFTYSPLYVVYYDKIENKIYKDLNLQSIFQRVIEDRDNEKKLRKRRKK